ncbi:hypothetical protein [Thermosporothrix hazakensis]|jgi:hypothetical protein|uniref:hypothetical protein n=1 Tax=Thermosporothrix hazakensis TaxID=644383 RepID=UPI000DACBF56|nr:hypothetical protein [Thermosporothrix hazakensis]GCE50698.1 hypothetical protein KTH_55670 [Thermosporothrix hazakensis]
MSEQKSTQFTVKARDTIISEGSNAEEARRLFVEAATLPDYFAYHYHLVRRWEGISVLSRKGRLSSCISTGSAVVGALALSQGRIEQGTCSITSGIGLCL